MSHSCSDREEKGEKKEGKETQTTLELCPVTVHQPSKVKQAELWERGERHLRLPGPARPAGEWQRLNKALCPSAT